MEAFFTEADETFYGGAAGGGKSDLLLGLASTVHIHTIIFRREFPQIRGLELRMQEILGTRDGYNSQAKFWRLPAQRTLEFGSVPNVGDEIAYQGRPHDLVGFDEITHFTLDQYQFLSGWVRSTRPGQRTRVVAAGNPPTTPEGEWVVQHWAPWLDEDHPNPAKPGELRWFVMLDGVDTEVATGEPFEFTDKDGMTEIVHPKSRTFIPAKVEDNPYLMNTGYKRQLQNLPEPLRSRMLKGNFGTKTDDNPWQVIPAAWVDAAVARWREDRPKGTTLSALGVDVARGGKDKTVLARRYEAWFAPLERHPGHSTPDGPAVAALVVEALGDDKVPVNMDVIGVGTSPVDALAANNITVMALNGSEGSKAKDRSGNLGFINKRAEWWWKMREALDPDKGDNLALPPDRELRNDLIAPRWKLTVRGIQIESKEDIKPRLGRSPDAGEAVVYANAIEEMAEWFCA